MRAGTIEKKEHLLSEGMKVMRRNGYAATSIDDIVKAAGIPKGSFYNFYASKEEFVAEALRFYTDQSRKMQDAFWNETSLDSKERIRGFFEAMAQGLKKEKFSTGCFIGNMAQEIGPTHPVLRKVIENCFQEIKEPLEKEILRGIREKTIPSRIRADRFADFLLNSWEGAITRMKASKSAVPLDQFLEYLDVLLNQK